MKIREEILESLLSDVYGILGSDITQDEQIALKRAFEISLGMPVLKIIKLRERALNCESDFKRLNAKRSEACSGAMALAYKFSAEVFTGIED